jgi:flavorubredoxin
MKVHVKNNVYWVGKTDWDLRKFHGDEYSTHKGSTYNSYLIKEEKTVLIDTVWKPYAEEFVENLKKEIDLNKIDFIISNHSEIDHSGALSELMRHIPETPIYCTAQGVKSLRGMHHNSSWDLRVVKTGDRLSIGNKELIFIEAPMLHWPDSMMCYLTGDNILFSNDAFGQHYASEYLFNDLVDRNELFVECMKYYANILNPFSPMVIKKIEEILSFNLPVDYICTSHGIIWRDNPGQIINLYLEWAKEYKENQITIVYDSMWESTRIMADNIIQGIKEADAEVNIKMYNIARSDKNDVILEIFKSKGVLFGSSTINSGILSGMAGLMEEVRGLKFKNKKGASFGSYGWSGESVKMLNDLAVKSGFELVNDGLKVLWTPDEEAKKQCAEFGKSFAKGCN